MNIARTSVFCLSLAGFATAAFAAAHSDKAAMAAVEARHAQMKLIAYHTGLLGAMAKGEMDYDAASAENAATNLHAAAGMARDPLWIEGTEQGTVEGSRAKAEIWSDPAEFDEKFMALETASAEMIDAASTDVESLRAAMGAIGQSCKGCHETYRGPEN